MPVETAADRAVFTNPDEFGTTAKYTLRSGVPAPDVDGIFDNAFGDLDASGEVGISGRQPMFTLNSADLPEDHGYHDQLEIKSKSYRAVRFEPDESEEQTVIILEKL